MVLEQYHRRRQRYASALELPSSKRMQVVVWGQPLLAVFRPKSVQAVFDQRMQTAHARLDGRRVCVAELATFVPTTKATT